MAGALKVYGILLFVFTAGGIVAVEWLLDIQQGDEHWYGALALGSLFAAPLLFGIIRRDAGEALKAFGISLAMNAALWGLMTAYWLGVWR